MYKLDDYCREALSAPEGWRVGAWHRGLESGDDECPANTIKLRGAIYELYRGGKNKGKTNYKKPIDGTSKTYFVLESDIRAWQEEKERRTGLCSDCEATGQRWAGWSAADGNRYQPCKRCNATGRVSKEPAA